MTSAANTDTARPLVSMLLIAWNQQATVGDAIAGALGQTYSPLEIVVSDDASTDDTWAAIERALAGYIGPHRVILNRNPVNLGIGAHLSRLVELSSGELLFVTAGDDVSLPIRCERIVRAWVDAGRRPDLIASALIDIDADGNSIGVITPSDLGTYRDGADWIARPPFVVGAAQAWTRRLIDRFGPLPAGVVAEDLIMVFRAIGSGGACTIAEPLVRYRRGGLSRAVRNVSAADVVGRLLRNNRSALVELPQLLADAAKMGQLEAVEAPLRARLEREQYIRDIFAAPSLAARIGAFRRARAVPLAARLRLGLYAAWPAAFAPFFLVKRALRG